MDYQQQDQQVAENWVERGARESRSIKNSNSADLLIQIQLRSEQ